MKGRLISISVAIFPSLRFVLILTSSVFLFGRILPSFADTEHIVDYTYDGAGNITHIHSNLVGPPNVTGLHPDVIQKERITTITATGIDLLGATVTTSTPGLNILNINTTSPTQVQFTLAPDSTTVVGSGSLTFSTHLGSDTTIINIIDRLAAITSVPNPIILAPDGLAIGVMLVFDQSFDIDKTYDFVIDNTIASVSPQSITLPAGSTTVSIMITGISSGITGLVINNSSGVHITTLGINVFGGPIG